jgi:hypothetical protein
LASLLLASLLSTSLKLLYVKIEMLLRDREVDG